MAWLFIVLLTITGLANSKISPDFYIGVSARRCVNIRYSMLDSRKTKILCTLGPSVSDERTFRKMVDAGLNAVRLNFSHGSRERRLTDIAMVRAAAAESDRIIPIVADLQGPKIRTGKLKAGQPVELGVGNPLRLCKDPRVGDAAAVSIDYPYLAGDVKPGARVLLADGAVELRVARIEAEDVLCEVVNDGVLGEHKGVNIPGAKLTVQALTRKDRADLEFAIAHGVDYIALSFVREAKDVELAKNLIEWAGGYAHVIAKIETPQALDNLDAILDAAAGVMVARGDLGVELSPWQAPIAQKRIIEECARLRKPVITATQMLESMIANPRPTRAESSDVANAVFDGSDVLMLSGETAVGAYPVETVAMMARIIAAAESHAGGPRLDLPVLAHDEADYSAQVAQSATRLAHDLQAKFIVIYTESGYSARLISKHRPTCPVLVLSAHDEICRRATLLWGVRARKIERQRDLADLLKAIDALVTGSGWAQPGDLLCIVAGTPFEIAGRTNMIQLHAIGS